MKLIYFFLILLITTTSNFSQKRAMTSDDALDIVELKNAIISPDGNYAIYEKTEIDWEKNKTNSKHFLISFDAKRDYQYVSDAESSSLLFSPNGTYISLKRKVDKHQQIFLINTSGGEAIQLTKHKNNIEKYLWSNDNKKIFFISSDPKSKEEEINKKNGDDVIYVDEGPNGQTEDEWNNIWVFDIETKKSLKLTNAKIIIDDFAVSPDGNKIVYTARNENRRNQSFLSEIFLFNITDSTTIQLTKNKSPESNLQWSPDGINIAFTAADDKSWELRNAKIWLMNTTNKEYKMISGNFVGAIWNYFFDANAKNIFFNGSERTNSNFYKLDINQGTIKNISNLVGSAKAFGFSKDFSKVYYSFDDYKTPADLYFTEVNKFHPTKLTSLNPDFEKKYELASAEVIKWKSNDGLEIEGILFLPPSYDNTKEPFLLQIHGGPADGFRNSFDARNLVWAGLGYVQLFPNIRGSIGYSDELLRGNMYDIGGNDYNDLMSGVDFLLSKGYIDENKMAVMGWSYGGILGGTVITKTNRFKAASLGAMVSDWTSEYGIGFNYDIRLWYIGGTYWENPEAYRQKSVLTHVKNINTPTLLLHGLNDITDTEAQSMMLFSALKDMGKTVKYVKFPREPHNFKEPRHLRTRDIEQIKWIQKYNLGIEWKPWVREIKKTEDENED